jgi:hypothetical protein
LNPCHHAFMQTERYHGLITRIQVPSNLQWHPHFLMLQNWSNLLARTKISLAFYLQTRIKIQQPTN